MISQVFLASEAFCVCESKSWHQKSTHHIYVYIYSFSLRASWKSWLKQMWLQPTLRGWACKLFFLFFFFAVDTTHLARLLRVLALPFTWWILGISSRSALHQWWMAPWCNALRCEALGNQLIFVNNTCTLVFLRSWWGRNNERHNKNDFTRKILPGGTILPGNWLTV